MTQIQTDLAYTPEAAAYAEKFGVPPHIHAEDFIFLHLMDLGDNPGSDIRRAHVLEYYFADGQRSAQKADELIRQCHPEGESRRLSMLEFASGYGFVSRHLRKMEDRYDLISCDIHPQAVRF